MSSEFIHDVMCISTPSLLTKNIPSYAFTTFSSLIICGVDAWMVIFGNYEEYYYVYLCTDFGWISIFIHLECVTKSRIVSMISV